jgi:serine protease AprX
VHALATRQLRGRTTAVLVLVAGLLGGHVSAASPATAERHDRPALGHLDPGLHTVGSDLQRVLVTGASAAEAVRAVGGRLGAALPLVDGVAATVPAGRLPELAAAPGVVAVTKERQVRFSATGSDAAKGASTFASPAAVGAAWSTGNRGKGVGIAVIDTGVSPVDGLADRLVHGPDLSGEGTTTDSHGHGTVMASVAAGGSGTHPGVAPEATVVAVKVAGRNGAVDVSTMLQAMHWVSAYADQYDIRVLNLSWGTDSTQDPAVDPLNHAVQRLWQQGIVVVVAAGNSGPHAGTITKPADDPMVLTVGAYDDKGDTNDRNDTVPAWSSRGPTAAGLAKPDVVAPGRTLVALRSPGSEIEAANPKGLVGATHIKGSGTSQAAAVVSGLSALVLAEHPSWTPDQVKRALSSTAAPLAGGSRTDQGAGRVRLAAALAAAPGPASWQTPTATGLGSLEASRGSSHVEVVCGDDAQATIVAGELDTQCEQWDGSKWTGSKWTGSKWTGSKWTGSKWTGSKWTGSAWTGGTWSGDAWSGEAWTGSTFAGSKWTGSKWTGSKWTGSKWTGSKWTGSKWTGSKWTGSKWTSTDLTAGDVTHRDDFLTVFWGQNPKQGLIVPGETSDAE